MTEGIHAKITADSSSFENGMKRAESSAKKFQSAAVTTQASLNKTSSSFGLARNSAQQFGYQIQDVAVQLGSGTNAAVVFAQQGSQIASIFGPGGAVIGAVIAIAGAVAGPFVASLGAAEDQVKTLVEELKGLETGLDDLTLAQRRFIESVNAPKIAALEQQINALSNEAESLIGILQSPIQDDDFIKKTTDRLIEVQAAADTAKKQLADLQQQQGVLGGTVESDKAKKIRESSEKEAKALQEKLDRQLEIEIAAEERLQQQKAAIRLALINQTAGLELEAENMNHEKKLEVIAAAFEGELEMTAEHNAILEEEEQRHMEALRNIRAAGMDSIAAIVQKSYGKQAGEVASALGDMLSSMSTHSKKAFEANKALAIGNAVVKGYSAAVAAWDAGMSTGGPWAPAVAAAYTAASIAKTSAQISAISSQRFGGGGNTTNVGGSGGGTTAATQQAAAAPASENSIVNINLEGNNFDRRSVVGLIEQINEAVADGARINIA